METYLLSSSVVGAAGGWRMIGSRYWLGMVEIRTHDAAVLDFSAVFAAAA